jgi:hypothetical protein
VEPVCRKDIFRTAHHIITGQGMNSLTPIFGKHIDFPHHGPGLGGGIGRRKGLKNLSEDFDSPFFIYITYGNNKIIWREYTGRFRNRKEPF